MRIVIVGAGGQLAHDITRQFYEHEVFGFTHEELDVADVASVKDRLDFLKPHIVINTAAYHRVDECEDNPEKSFLVNAVAVRNLSLLSNNIGAVLVHFSTDYVFGGEKRTPYVEEDCPCPLSVYANSKLAGEYFVRVVSNRYFLIRTCGLYGKAGSRGKGGNFIETMIKMAKEGKYIRVVNDQIVTPTYTYDLACKLKELISTQAYGLYHMTNTGCCSWYEFARYIFGLLSINANVIPVSSKEYGAKARRPAYSVLDNKRLRNLGLRDMRHWKEAVKDYLKEKGYI